MIVAVDFDGTIVSNAWPRIGIINQHTKDFILWLQKQGHTWILLTMREGEKLQEAVAFCKEHGLNPDYVNDNTKELIEQFGNNPRKIYADIYIDDHIPFSVDYQVYWARDRIIEATKYANIQTES